MATAAQRRYWTRLAADGCLVCGAPSEIAHASGASVRERMQEPKAKGRKLARYDWLVLNLCHTHHRLGPVGVALDVDRERWESIHGTQASHIDALCERFGLDLWKLAKG